jgi:hypothetical protein
MDIIKRSFGIGKIMINLNKIVVVGGGSAGWMAAATLIKQFPEKEIVCIESPDFPIVGVGESTLGGIRVWTKFLGIDEKDFMQYTDASYKLAIKFTDFYDKGAGSFYYPFGKPHRVGTNMGLNDWYFKKVMYPETPVSDYAYTFYPAVALCEKNKISDNKLGRLPSWKKEMDVAYHFDAIKFGQWLKNNYCIPRGVKLISSTVKNILVNENGIEFLELENGEKITADLFVDSTGFKSLLLEKTLNEEWLDYSAMLPNNRAWATRIPYTDKEKELEPYTNCTAIENGWVWNIPSWERIGTGYVYSDKYVSPEQALVEFKNYLRSKYMTVPDENRDVDSFEYRDVPFRIGIHKRTWVKNVVAIGLAAGFIEPLESNGLYTTHEFLLKLIRVTERGRVSQTDIDMYNAVTKSMFDTFAFFVSAHYAMSIRQDTKYWQDISNRHFDPSMQELNVKFNHGYLNLAEDLLTNHKLAPESGMGCIATGLHHFPIDKVIADMFNLNSDENDVYANTEKVIRMWDLLHVDWEREADESPTVYQYLKDNIHNE